MPRPPAVPVPDEKPAKIPVVVCQKLDLSKFKIRSDPVHENGAFGLLSRENSIVEIPDDVFREFTKGGKLRDRRDDDRNNGELCDDYCDDETSEDECYSWQTLSVRDRLYADAKVVLTDCSTPRESRRLRRFGYKFTLKGKRKYDNHPLVDYYQSLSKVIIKERPDDAVVPEKCNLYAETLQIDEEIEESPPSVDVVCDDPSPEKSDDKFDDSSKENSPPQHIVSMTDEELLSGELHLTIPSLDDLDDPCLVDKIPLDDFEKDPEPSILPPACPPEELLRDVESVLSEYLDNLGETDMFKCCCVQMRHSFDNISKTSPWFPKFMTAEKGSTKENKAEHSPERSEQKYKCENLNDVLDMKVDSRLSNNRSLPKSINFGSNKLKSRSNMMKRMKSLKIMNHQRYEWKSWKRAPYHRHCRRLRSKHLY